jgi:hypothetical protein
MGVGFMGGPTADTGPRSATTPLHPLTRSVVLIDECPLNARLVTGVGLSFFLSFLEAPPEGGAAAAPPGAASPPSDLPACGRAFALPLQSNLTVAITQALALSDEGASMLLAAWESGQASALLPPNATCSVLPVAPGAPPRMVSPAAVRLLQQHPSRLWRVSSNPAFKETDDVEEVRLEPGGR